VRQLEIKVLGIVDARCNHEEYGSCLGTRRNQPSQSVTEIILQQGEPYVNIRRSV